MRLNLLYENTTTDLATFKQYLQQSGLTFSQLLKKLQTGKPSGCGGNADFYEIPGTEFGIRVIRWAGPGYGSESDKLEGVHDPFEGENLGQPIAQYGNIQILKLQHGTPAGMPFRYDRKGGVGVEAGVKIFEQQILAAASFDIKEYVRLMQSIKSLNDKGYQIDPSKSGNMLIDVKRGRFNLVDISKRCERSNYKNSADEIAVMLINNFEFDKHLKQKPEMRQAARQILQKVAAAAAESGLEMGDDSSIQYSYKLSQEPAFL